jgi:AcrR family transcriptional regulator
MTHDDPRERILEAAMDTIAERGMSGLRMADVGERVGMSPGHILYYYRSKQRLLLETLRWSDDKLAEQRARELPELATAGERLERFVTIYLPTGTAHPEWLLWLQAWALGAEDPEVAAVTGALNARWAGDLAEVVRYGSTRGEFAPVDAQRFADEFLAVLDGLSLHVLHDTPALDPGRAAAVALGIAAGQLHSGDGGTALT